MCDSYRVIDKDCQEHDCDTLGELACALNMPFSVLMPDRAEDGKDQCLCDLNHTHLCRVAFVSIRKANQEEGWPHPWYIVRAQAH